MPDLNAQSQTAFGSSVARTPGESLSCSNEAPVDSQVLTCEKLLDKAIEKNWPATTLMDALKWLGLKAAEAVDYIKKFSQHMEIHCSKAGQSRSPPHDLSVEALGHAEEQKKRDKAIEEAAWASLQTKLEATAPAQPAGSPSNALDKMLELLSQEASTLTSLSKSVLAVALHLGKDEDTVFEDPYLSETQKCKMAYASQKPFENLVIKAQGQKMCEPIVNSIWRLIILDKYVDFAKLYVTLDPGYNPKDEAKELNERFTLLERNSISSKHPVLTESEWMCLYDVWVDSVLYFYPHRKIKLISYHKLIINMFRATSSPFPAIRYDRDSQERYACQPYRLDSSKDVLPFPLLSELLSHANDARTTDSTSPSPLLPSSKKQKQSETICQNWNLGICDGDTCYYGHWHNECSKYDGCH